MAKANIKNILKSAIRDKSTKKIIFNVVIVLILSYLTFYFTKSYFYNLAFWLTPHIHNNIPCLGYYYSHGKMIYCNEGPSNYTYALFYSWYVPIIFLYSLIAGLLSRPKYKILGRTIFYSFFSIIVLILLGKFLKVILY